MFQVEKINTTIQKIKEVKNSNFDKKDMNHLWMGYISEKRSFCDVIFALAEHEENNDNIKFNAKLEKTAKALNLPTSDLTPLLLKYLILWTEEHKKFNKHLMKLSQLILDDELEAKTNIVDVAQGKVKSNRNRFCLNTDMKSLIDDSLKGLDISKTTNYIKFLGELRIVLSNHIQNIALKELPKELINEKSFNWSNNTIDKAYASYKKLFPSCVVVEVNRKCWGQGVKTPWRYLSNGAKMHKSSIVITSFSIKSPFHSFYGGQKKSPEVNYSPGLCHSTE